MTRLLRGIGGDRTRKMARRKLLLLLKPFDVYPIRKSNTNDSLHALNHQITKYLDNRRKIHKDTINFCQNILQKKSLDWETMLRSDLSKPIRNVDLVITIGGDGTLLQASHFMDCKIPVLGVNSDPTQPKEVEELNEEFDATRSTGYLCASTVNNFEQMLEGILQGDLLPSNLSRLSIHVNSKLLSRYALNDILVAHPCPAAVSRFSFRIKKDGDGEPCTPLGNSRSSGLRLSTAAGSTAAMLSAGGFPMDIFSQDLQYMVREPISPGVSSSLMHGLVKAGESMDVSWSCKEGVIYIDGCHERHPIKSGDEIELSSKAPPLQVYLPSHFSS